MHIIWRKESAHHIIQTTWPVELTERSSPSAYQGEDDHKVISEYFRLAHTTSNQPKDDCDGGQGNAYCGRSHNVGCSVVMDMCEFILDLGW